MARNEIGTFAKVLGTALYAAVAIWVTLNMVPHQPNVALTLSGLAFLLGYAYYEEAARLKEAQDRNQRHIERLKAMGARLGVDPFSPTFDEDMKRYS